MSNLLQLRIQSGKESSKMGYRGHSKGRNKKRKSGRSKVKLAVRKNLSFTSKKIREQWDASKTVKQNLEKLGLASDVNKIGHQENSSTTKEIVQLFDVPKSDNLNKKERLPLEADDQKYIARCMAKHGQNYSKMFYDLKVNRMQHTEHKLRTMGSRFLLLEKHQRVVEVPEKVKNLVREEDI